MKKNNKRIEYALRKIIRKEIQKIAANAIGFLIFRVLSIEMDQRLIRKKLKLSISFLFDLVGLLYHAELYSKHMHPLASL